MFGPDLLLAPVVRPANASSNMADKQVWLPPGRWVEHLSGRLYTGSAAVIRVLARADGQGDTVLEQQYDLSEIPVFVRAGAIIPSIPLVLGDTLGLLCHAPPPPLDTNRITPPP